MSPTMQVGLSVAKRKVAWLDLGNDLRAEFLDSPVNEQPKAGILIQYKGEPVGRCWFDLPVNRDTETEERLHHEVLWPVSKVDPLTIDGAMKIGAMMPDGEMWESYGRITEGTWVEEVEPSQAFDPMGLM